MNVGGMACCGITPISGFPYDPSGNTAAWGDEYSVKGLETLEETFKKEIAGGRATGANICALTSRQSRAKAILIKYGFKEVAKFKSTHGDGTDVFILMRGDSVEKIIKKKVKKAA